MRNIALSGGMGAGKSTIADHLCERYGYELRKISTPIYEMAERLWGPEVVKDRARLQDFGVKMKEIDDDVWLNLFMRELEDRENGPLKFKVPPVVNDTTRFPNEFWTLKNADFVMIRVLAPEATRIDRLQKIGRIQDLDRLTHVTETALFGAKAESEGIHFDYEITNDGDTEHMEFEVRNLVKRLEEES